MQIFPVAFAPVSLQCLDKFDTSQMNMWKKILDENDISLEEHNGKIFAIGQIGSLFKAQTALDEVVLILTSMY